MTDTLPIAETFGPTFQGEGPSAGQLAAFVRVGGCNLTCRACDTPYTWDASRFDLRVQLTPMTSDAILAALPDTPLVVVTGGEPTLYRSYPAMHQLLGGLAARRVEIETNGTLPPAPLDEWQHVTFNVSPKLAGPMSDDPEERRIVPEALAAYGELAWAGRAAWKFVVAGPEDLAAALTLVDTHRVPLDRVWFMPEGNDPARSVAIAQTIAEPVLAAGANLTLRQHILLWPTVERGR